MSMESALIPVPLCFVDFLMVSQMSPGRWCSWIGVVCSGKVRCGTGLEYNFSTVAKLLWLMVAIVGCANSCECSSIVV